MAQDASSLSKSARKRANKKTRVVAVVEQSVDAPSPNTLQDEDITYLEKRLMKIEDAMSVWPWELKKFVEDTVILLATMTDERFRRLVVNEPMSCEEPTVPVTSAESVEVEVKKEQHVPSLPTPSSRALGRHRRGPCDHSSRTCPTAHGRASRRCYRPTSGGGDRRSGKTYSPGVRAPTTNDIAGPTSGGSRRRSSCPPCLLLKATGSRSMLQVRRVRSRRSWKSVLKMFQWGT